MTTNELSDDLRYAIVNEALDLAYKLANQLHVEIVVTGDFLEGSFDSDADQCDDTLLPRADLCVRWRGDRAQIYSTYNLNCCGHVYSGPGTPQIAALIFCSECGEAADELRHALHKLRFLTDGAEIDADSLRRVEATEEGPAGIFFRLKATNAQS